MKIKMKSFLIVSLLTFNACAINESQCKQYLLEDKTGFSPIRKEIQACHDDKDICEIFHGKDLQDCGVNNEGPTPPTSPVNTPSK